MERYDAVIIGSGMGGLTAASLLARLGRARVLVLERHFKLGGFTHTFQRPGGYHWDVGLHYVGRMEDGALGRQLFDLITDGGVTWAKVPDPFDVFDYPGMAFECHSGRERFREDLSRAFPAEREAIGAYLDDLRTVQAYTSEHAAAQLLPWPISPVLEWRAHRLEGLALQRTADYLAHRFRDPKLRSLVVSQWGDYGLPPRQSAFVLHALIAHHYLKGAWYPAGTAKTIADSVIPVVKEAGGDLRVDCEVEEILVDGNRARGVRYAHRQGKEVERHEVQAEVVISDAGAAATYGKLLRHGGEELAAGIERLGGSTATATLYLGLKESPARLGLQGGNRWIYQSWDHEETFARVGEVLTGKAGHAYLSFPSLKDPLATAHTAEVICAVPWEPFVKWRDQPWKKRGAEYQALKDRISDALLDLVESRHPGFKELVAYRELSTPLTNEHFTGHARGAIYGIPGVPERWKLPGLGPRTPVKGLWLAGADAASLGILGALMGGVLAAAGVLGLRGVPRIMGAARAWTGPRARPLASAG